MHLASFLHYCLSTDFLHDFWDFFIGFWSREQTSMFFRWKRKEECILPIFLLLVKTSFWIASIDIKSWRFLYSSAMQCCTFSTLCRHLTSWRYLKRDLLNALPVTGHRRFTVSLWNSHLRASRDQLGDKCVAVLTEGSTFCWMDSQVWHEWNKNLGKHSVNGWKNWDFLPTLLVLCFIA